MGRASWASWPEIYFTLYRSLRCIVKGFVWFRSSWQVNLKWTVQNAEKITGKKNSLCIQKVDSLLITFENGDCVFLPKLSRLIFTTGYDTLVKAIVHNMNYHIASNDNVFSEHRHMTIPMPFQLKVQTGRTRNVGQLFTIHEIMSFQYLSICVRC